MMPCACRHRPATARAGSRAAPARPRGRPRPGAGRSARRPRQRERALQRRDLTVAAGLVLLALLLAPARPGGHPRLGRRRGLQPGHRLAPAARPGAGQFALDYAFVQHPVLCYALLAPLLGPVRAPAVGGAGPGRRRRRPRRRRPLPGGRPSPGRPAPGLPGGAGPGRGPLRRGLQPPGLHLQPAPAVDGADACWP